MAWHGVGTVGGHRKVVAVLAMIAAAALSGAGAAAAVLLLHPDESAPGLAVQQPAPLQALQGSVGHSGLGPAHGSPPTPARAAGPCVDVPILVYHYIRLVTSKQNLLGYNLSVSPTEFQTQMDWLRLAGGHTVTLAQVVRAMLGGPALPSHPVVLTFDDGYVDFATTATPILHREGFVAIDYVVSGFLERPSYMTAQQVRDVAAQGMIIGAHTVHHVDLRALPSGLAGIEINASKRSLELVLHHAVTDFAYPYGDYNASVSTLVAQAGFSDAVTMDAGITQCASQLYTLHRERVTGGDTVWTFARTAGVTPPPPAWKDSALPSAHRF